MIRRWGASLLLSLLMIPSELLAQGLDWQEALNLQLKGEYDESAALCKKAMEQRYYREEWALVLGQTLLTTGKYTEALQLMTEALTRFRRSLPIRLLAREVYLQNGDRERAKELLEELNLLAASRRWETDAGEMLAVGKSVLLLGGDARLVLENFFNQAKKLDPKLRGVYLAIGELALEKNDYDLAAKTFTEGLTQFADDPEMLFGLARAFGPSDRPKMVQNLEAALEKNPKHIPSLLLLVDHMIDAEEYQEANDTLEKIFKVNPAMPEAWAYRASIEHVRNQLDQEKASREAGLKFWKDNPRVDYLIGQKLSEKYRFIEGSKYQRQALQSEESFLPAKIQLAQDLMRLGEEEEGWALAEEVHKQDGYDVMAFNLVTLKENLQKFSVLTSADFRVRMDPHEAGLYGQRVLRLLERAKETLSKKYGLNIDRQVVVEIFPEQKDFAIRTFGMPGGEGYLGVCFGHVITANSPAAQGGNPSNWEAVLWHEFCHVVTLGLTRNKMPRWLSEGISVYEERQENPAWGQAMNPTYRKMILKGELSPVSEMSGAFLTPKTPMHLQFAYYQSSLVVEFLIERFGIEAIKKILLDLGEGKGINETIEKHTAPMAKVESDFIAYARNRADLLGPGLEWTELSPEELEAEPAKLIEKYPKNYFALMRAARKLVADKKWAEAKAPLEKVLEHYPDSTGSGSPYLLLARVYQGLGDLDGERQMLQKLAVQDAGAVDAYLRLMEICAEKSEWSAVEANAERALAVNPLVAAPYRFLGRATEASRKTSEAIGAYEKLLVFQPADLADVHYRLANLLHSTGGPGAKRHVLQALEDAPRFREAHRLLLELQKTPDGSGAKSPAAEAGLQKAPEPAVVEPKK